MEHTRLLCGDKRGGAMKGIGLIQVSSSHAVDETVERLKSTVLLSEDEYRKQVEEWNSE